MRLIATFFLSLMISGCAGSPYRLAKMSAAELRDVPSEKLIVCMQHKGYDTEAVYNEAVRRNLLTVDEVEYVKKRQVVIGMSERSLWASWGYGNKVNTSHGQWGTHKQYVYSGSKTRSPKYVYVENGKVTSWQD